MKTLLALTLAAGLLAPSALIAQSRDSQIDRRSMNESDWSAHVRACKAQYRSYNERTDRYSLRAGVTRQCLIATPRNSVHDSVDRRGMSTAQWDAHVRRCDARYRSYNERTDTYTVRRGVTARCNLR